MNLKNLNVGIAKTCFHGTFDRGTRFLNLNFPPFKSGKKDAVYTKPLFVFKFEIPAFKMNRKR